MAALRACVAAWAVAGAAADRCCGKDGYNSPHGDVALSENGDDLCCREYAAPGRTPLIEQLKCDVLPTESCFANEATGFMDSKDLGRDPGECCAACLATAGCKAWVHVPGTGSGPGKPQSGQTYECNLFSSVGPTRASHDGCTAGTVPASAPPAPPVPPRNGKPNILFLVVESTDGRTWTPGYQDGAIPELPTFKMLQDGGLNFKKHYATETAEVRRRPGGSTPPPSASSARCARPGVLPVALHLLERPARPPHSPRKILMLSPFVALSVSLIQKVSLLQTHPGYANITVGGAWNNYEGLPANYSRRLDQVMSNRSLTNYQVKVAGKTDWATGGHSVNVHLDAWTMYAQWPYNISAMGGWNEENGCIDPGVVLEGGGPGSKNMKTSAHKGDWQTLVTTTDWITEASKNKEVPWFAFQGMNIVHPPYHTNDYFLDMVDQSKVDVPAWTPLAEMHPCDFQSSMLKGCMPSPYQNLTFDFYSEDHRRRIRSIYYAMIAEFDSMVGEYVQTIKDAGVWEETVLIVTSDHGDMQMEKQQFYKMVPYDASASVPMVIYDARPGRQNPKAGPTIERTTQLIDIFPTVLDLAGIPKAQWPDGLDGYSLKPLMAVAGDEEVVDDRPDFIVSQFHGDNVAMSWFVVVKNGVTNPRSGKQSTFKLIVWGTGAEVPSLLFDLLADPMEDADLIKDPEGFKAYAGVVSELEQNLRSVVNYPAVAQSVAEYGKAMLAEWVKQTPDWQTAIHAPGLRWSPSWNWDSDAAFAALHEYMATPAKVVACRPGNETVWPPPHRGFAIGPDGRPM